jgi:hypothetical protein
MKFAVPQTLPFREKTRPCALQVGHIDNALGIGVRDSCGHSSTLRVESEEGSEDFDQLLYRETMCEAGRKTGT